MNKSLNSKQRDADELAARLERQRVIYQFSA